MQLYLIRRLINVVLGNDKRIWFLLICVLFVSACRLPVYETSTRSWDEQKRQLRSELDSLQTDFEKTTRLRQFVAQNVDLGNSEINCSKQGIDFSNLSAKAYYDYFENDAMTVYCGGTSYFLLRVFEEFGYKSYTYDVGGKEASATHQFNLVNIIDNGVEKLIVQDAYFNHSVMHAVTRKPIDFSDLLTFVEQDQLDSIVLNKTNFLGNTLSSTKEAYDYWQVSPKSEIGLFKSLNEHAPYLIRSPRSIDMFLDSEILRTRYCDFLESHGHACDLVYLILYPLGDSRQVLQSIIEKKHGH